MIDDDRGQFTTPPAFIVTIVGLVVLVLLVVEFGPSILALAAIVVPVLLFLRMTLIFGPASTS